MMLEQNRRPGWARLRFAFSWILAAALIGVAVPRAVDVSWHGVIPVLTSVHWPALLVLVGLWLLGLYVHSFVLTAAAPSLTHRRALTLNMTGSAVTNKPEELGRSVRRREYPRLAGRAAVGRQRSGRRRTR